MSIYRLLYMQRLIITVMITIYLYMCVFYRLNRDVMQLKKPRNIKTKPNQTKLVKITKNKNINVCTNNHTLL